MKTCVLSLMKTVCAVISVNFGIIGDVKASLLNQKTFTGYALLASSYKSQVLLLYANSFI